MKNIILIHGLHMSPINLLYLQQKLKTQLNPLHYQIHKFGYKSIHFQLNDLDRLDKLVSTFPKEQDVIIIAHSMGGLVSRLYLKQYMPQRNIKLITLGTPHQGSLVAKNIYSSFLKPILGSSIHAGLIQALPEWQGDYELISIAGIKNVGLVHLFTKQYNQLSDGTVFLSETYVKNAQHIIINNMHHTQMIYSKRIVEELKKHL